MPLFQIDFDYNIDNSLSVGDIAYYCNADPTDGICIEPPQIIGPITGYGVDYIVVDTTVSASITIGVFIFFSKPIQVEESGLKGYYADVTFENNSKIPIELFAISSEAVISSK